MRLATVTLVLFASLLAACSSKHGSQAGSSELAGKLVGHWSTGSDDHLYFGPIEAAASTGSYILVHPDGKAFTHKYQVDSADAGSRTIKATFLFASGDSREETFVLSEDAQSAETITEITGIETRGHLTKVDGATAP